MSHKESKLYHTTSDKCQAHHVINSQRIINSNKIPIISYPNHQICWEATDWIIDLWRGGKKPSSLETYSSRISMFVRYIYHLNLPFEATDDFLLNSFSKKLQEEDKIRGPNHVGEIIRRTIDALIWMQHNNYFTRNVIGIDDSNAQVKCTIKSSQHKNKSGRVYKNTYLHHESIPRENITEERRAIPNHVIDKLWEAIPQFKTLFRQQRAKTILFILENTGGRRIESSQITIDDIYSARKSGFLRLHTAKQPRIDSWRDIPIEPNELDTVLNYIEHYRNPLIKKKLASGAIDSDSGFLFISNWGRPLSPKTISDEIATLRRLAGISDPAHPHLFRHRYTTVLLDRIHQTMNDLGLGAISNSATQKLMSLMGWKSEDMVNTYNDQYLSESDGWKQIEKAFLSRLSDENSQRKLSLFIKRLNSGKQIELEEQEELLLFLANLMRKIS